MGCTGLPNKVCPRLRDSACWRSGEITQPRTSLIRGPCTDSLIRTVIKMNAEYEDISSLHSLLVSQLSTRIRCYSLNFYGCRGRGNRNLVCVRSQGVAIWTSKDLGAPSALKLNLGLRFDLGAAC